MRTVVSLGASPVLRPQRAFLTYAVEPGSRKTMGEGDTYTATAPVLGVDGQGVPQLGAWGPVTEEMVRELGEQLGVRLAPEVLPSHVLCRTQDMIAWWSAPQVRTLFFADVSGLAALDGRDLPIPGLVWKLMRAEGKLYVRALDTDERPERENVPLFHAPFLNVERNGLVCQGTMQRPRAVSVSRLREWEEGVFAAAFTNQLHDAASTVQAPKRKDLSVLWPMLRRKRRFPASHLLAAKQTLNAFLEVK